MKGKNEYTASPIPAPIEHPMKRNEDYCKNYLLKTLRTDPEKIKLSMYYQHEETYKEFG